MSTPTSAEPTRAPGRRRKTVGAAIATLIALCLGVAGWLAHGYLYDASFMQVPDGYSGVSIDTCTTGETLYFGYSFVPTRDVHLTGAELVDVPDGFTVEGIYAINQAQSRKALFGGGTQQDWDRAGYSKDHLYPVSAVDLRTGGIGWWLVAKVVPTRTGKQTIRGIKVSYTSGWRSGSSVYNEQIMTDCPE